MTKKIFIVLISFLLFSFNTNKAILTSELENNTGKVVSSKARKLAHKIIIVDSHIDMPDHSYRNGTDVSQASPEGQFDFPRAKEGGLDAAFMAIYVGAALNDEEAYTQANTLIDLVDELTMDHPDKFRLAYRVKDVRNQFSEGIVSLPMGMENGSPLKGDIATLDYFYARGIRYITLCHNNSNKLCDSSTDPNQPHGGLSDFGKEVIQKMNQLGMMVDVSHVSDATIEQVLELSTAPIIASHSGCKKFTPNFPRNLTDDLIKKIASKGGVVMINFGNMFLNQEASDNMLKMGLEMDERQMHYFDPEFEAFENAFITDNPMNGNVQQVVDHIEYITQLVGIDHVGFGSDFDGVGPYVPEGLEDVSKYPALIEELMKRGYSDDFLEKICGENFLRVWEEVEMIANK